jgi:hypothetical protein
MKIWFFSVSGLGCAFMCGLAALAGHLGAALFFGAVAIFLQYCAVDAAQEAIAEFVRKALDPLAVAHQEEASIHG